MPRTLTTLLALAALVTATPGCIYGRARDDRPLDPARLLSIQVGKSTKRDVVEILGAPTFVNDRLGFRVLAPQGGPQAGSVPAPLVDELVRQPLDHSYTYVFSDTKSTSLYLLIVSWTNQETHYDRAVFFFDEKGVLTHMGVTLDAPNGEFRLATSG
jgi:hypothetical protein